jgi:hypothetical protein
MAEATLVFQIPDCELGSGVEDELIGEAGPEWKWVTSLSRLGGFFGKWHTGPEFLKQTEMMEREAS